MVLRVYCPSNLMAFVLRTKLSPRFGRDHPRVRVVPQGRPSLYLFPPSRSVFFFACRNLPWPWGDVREFPFVLPRSVTVFPSVPLLIHETLAFTVVNQVFNLTPPFWDTCSFFVSPETLILPPVHPAVCYGPPSVGG